MKVDELHALMEDPIVKEMWKHRDTRLLLGAGWCGLLIKGGYTPNPAAVDSFRQEYSPAEMEDAIAELEAGAESEPDIADTCRRAAAFIRDQLLQRKV